MAEEWEERPDLPEQEWEELFWESARERDMALSRSGGALPA